MAVVCASSSFAIHHSDDYSHEHRREPGATGAWLQRAAAKQRAGAL